MTSSPELVAELFDLVDIPEIKPRYNIAPTQQVPIARLDESGKVRLNFVRWGLIPFWAKESAIGNRLINARVETAAQKPAFRAAFAKRRCLIPADGFYEWKKLPGARKQPILIRRRDRKPFAFAGLWESWSDPADGEVESCTILMTAPTQMLRDVHDRMPLIVGVKSFAKWLNAPSDAKRLQNPAKFRMARLDAQFELVPISTRINSPRNDSPACQEPASSGDLFD